MIRAHHRAWAEHWSETPAHIARTWLPIRAIELRILAESYDFRHAARGSEDGGEDTDREGKGDVRVDDIRGFRCGFRCAQPTLRARLKRLVASGGLDLALVPCHCRPGTEGTRACNYGRSGGTPMAPQKDVGQTLIEAGLARPYRCSGYSCPRRQSWCGAGR